MAARSVGRPRGVLHRVPQGASRHARHAPPEDLAPFVQHFWTVRWDLRGKEPVLQETLPHPSVHLVLEESEARVAGVVRGRFSRLLEGQGRVFGIKFRPGGFYPFVRWPVCRITNRVLQGEEVFGEGARALAAAVLEQEDEWRMCQIAAGFLRARRPERDPTAERVGLAVDRIVDDRGINTVEDLVRELGLGARTLQRLFSRYVGIGPKWVIQRYRLHEAIESIKAGQVLDWAQLALDLGYFDQAHFVRDFKALVGRPPGDYARSLAE